MTQAAAAIDDRVSDEMVRCYQQDGFVQVRGLVDREEALACGEAAQQYVAANRDKDYHGGSIFSQHVNAWRDDAVMASLTRDPRVGAAASRLAGVPLRLWHDQILIKQPGKSTATEWHQDQPYWPHEHRPNPISMWIALCDVPTERGCMSFIPGSHRQTALPAQDLADASSLMEICPALKWDKQVTVPLRAGDCTFHHGRCAHMATPNKTDVPRVAHVVIFIDADTPFNGEEHPVTDPLGLEAGQALPDGMFPPVVA